MRRVIEQVRAETEQWSQMQGMLRQVRKEMEELQASRDFWEDRALDSDCEIQSLNSAVRNQAPCLLQLRLCQQGELYHFFWLILMFCSFRGAVAKAQKNPVLAGAPVEAEAETRVYQSLILVC